MVVFEYIQSFWINELPKLAFKNAINEMREALSKESKEVKAKYLKWQTDDKMIIRYSFDTQSKFNKEGKRLAN